MQCKKNKEVSADDIFQCDMCGECCRGFGGTYVKDNEIEEISVYLGIDRSEFLKKYCQKSCSGMVLSQKDDGFCVFFDKSCTIHAVKPHMCKAWPFIDAVVRDVSNWRIMANACKGIRIDFPDWVIVECVKKVIDERGR